MKAASIIALLLASLFLLVAGATADTARVQNVQVNTVGATMPVTIVLDTPDAGIAGYDITVSVSNPSVATITGVSFPSWAILNESTALPASSVRLRTVDLNEQVNPGAMNVPFGTITLRGLATGTTDVVVTVKDITADASDRVTPGIQSGTVIVDSAISEPIIANHTSTNLSRVPLAAISQAKANLHIAYGHTSHGNQIIVGMNGLETFANAPYGGSTYTWNNGGTGGALDLRDTPFSGASDLGAPDRIAWANATRDYLEDPANSDVNVIMWSWCGQADTEYEEDITTYLNLMNELEGEYPDVTFVYMTGHLVGTGEAGDLNQRNEQIRNYVRANNKVLYDFADIESYDPDGLVNYMKLNANDNCDYDGGHNWATEWQAGHTEGVDWYDCSPDHTQALNGNRKAYAAWWLWARLGGWDGTPATGAPDTIGVFRPSTHMFYLDKSGNGGWGSGDALYSFGATGDLPLAGDWNGDNTTEIGVFRNSTHKFYLDTSGNGAWGSGDALYSFGATGDFPVAGDWDNDGTTEIGVFRNSTHKFYLDKSGNGVWGSGDAWYSFGATGDKPLAGMWG